MKTEVSEQALVDHNRAHVQVTHLAEAAKALVPAQEQGQEQETRHRKDHVVHVDR